MNKPPSSAQIVSHRFGIAKAALKKICSLRQDRWEDEQDFISSLRMEAESALRAMQDRPGSRKRARRAAALVGAARKAAS